MFRYGGEEFVVLAPVMQEVELAACLDAIRQQLAVSRWEALPASWQQTISAGVVCLPAWRPGQSQLATG
jgi:toxin CptA